VSPTSPDNTPSPAGGRDETLVPVMLFIAAPVSWLAALSVCVDLITFAKRQTWWENTHPGQTYVRRYKELVGK
jgi:hypothetical protein